jgi:hypothetical protein
MNNGINQMNSVKDLMRKFFGLLFTENKKTIKGNINLIKDYLSLLVKMTFSEK